MNGIKNFQVRKFSCLKGSEWEHFPSRNDISLTVVNRSVIKVIWKTTAEINTNISVVSAYSKAPAMGFKYTTFVDASEKRFQVSFIDASEHALCVAYLQNECGIEVSDPSLTKGTSIHRDTQQMFAPPATPMNPVSQMMFTDSQFAPPAYHQSQPQYPSQPVFTQPSNVFQPPPQSTTPAFPPYHAFPYSQPLLAQHAPSQASIAAPQDIGPVTVEPSLGYLSQILDPKKDNSSLALSPKVVTSVTMEELDKMSDKEINELLREKIKDINFINFVERIETCLKDLQG